MPKRKPSLYVPPLLWQKIAFFWNTPAVSLTHDLAAENDARILLLGCGDLRNMCLAYNSLRERSNQRRLDFTACDMEAAVLARNLLIFTLILDGENSGHIWEIFFHFKISTNANKLLVSQCQKLHQLTASLESWESSTYSHTIRIGTLDTLPQLHQRFRQYSTFDQAAAPKYGPSSRLKESREVPFVFTAVVAFLPFRCLMHWKTIQVIFGRLERRLLQAQVPHSSIRYSSSLKLPIGITADSTTVHTLFQDFTWQKPTPAQAISRQ
ncbi:hypothetical protein DL96DRAFT_1718550 [Flagelloscypha sp. PMI_526]|nr:hypothetical protein DL96DRAFT_1718550 [Flagelloscypha sp. PMI_526]